MTYIRDDFKKHEDTILDLYKAGKSIGYIKSVTGVSRIRLEHGLAEAAANDKALEARRLEAIYPSQRKKPDPAPGRWPNAQIIIERHEPIRKGA